MIRISSFTRCTLLLTSVVFLGAGCTSNSSSSTTPTFGGVFRSDDGGRTFMQKSTYVDGGDITRIAPLDALLDPFTPTTLYLVGGQVGIVKSTKSGDVWKPLPSIPTAQISSLVIHPRNPHILYISGTAKDAPTRSRIWKSFDDGATWSELYAEPIGTRAVDRGIFTQQQRLPNSVLTLGVNPDEPNILYAGSNSGALLLSIDGGTTWTTRRTFQQGISALKVVPGNTHTLFFRLQDGTLARSTDDGATATRVPIEAGEAKASLVRALYVSAQDDTIVVLAGTDRGLFRSDNGGDTWTFLPLPIAATQLVPITAITLDGNGALWVGSASNLYTSTDGGGTWHVRQFPTNESIRFLLADPSNANRVYIVFSPT